MGIKVTANGDVQTVEMSGDIRLGGGLIPLMDLQGNPLDDMRDTLQKLLDVGHRKILLNLQKVNFIDSAGLGELVACKKRALERGGDIKLLWPNSRVHDLLEMLHLTEIFEVFQDESTALKSF